MPKDLTLTKEQTQTIEALLKRGKVVEVKVEHGKPCIIEIDRKKVDLAKV